MHAILLDGHAAGHWKHFSARASSPSKPNSIAADQSGVETLEAAVERYGQFLGQPAASLVVLTD